MDTTCTSVHQAQVAPGEATALAALGGHRLGSVRATMTCQLP
jgi:hypothetical protein